MVANIVNFYLIKGDITTGEEVTTTAGGTGEGEAFRGGVCALGDAVGWGTGNGFSCFECLSFFLGSLSGADVPEDED